MSCLPLFSFSPSIPAAFRPFNDLSASKPDSQCPSPPSIASKTPSSPRTLYDLYDKLSRVSVSHRRVDSFEWVIAQSAPNTPQTSDGTSFKPFSPPAERLVSSAPLPVPNEHWSTRPKSTQQRGYLDWWSTPSLSNGKGYAVITDVGENCGPYDSSTCSLFAGSPESHTNKADTSSGSYSYSRTTRTTSVCPRDCDELRPSQELNALGIVLPDTPPPSPLTSEVLDKPQPCAGRNHPAQASNQRLPKRVTFSPVVDQVIVESYSDIKEQRPTHWGSYLPSSFLVARPPLPRTSSLPVTKAKTLARPILRRSSSSELRNTEMVRLSPRTDNKSTTTISSPLPCQRLPVSQLTVSGVSGGDRDDVEKAFASLLQATHKPSRERSASSSCGT